MKLITTQSLSGFICLLFLSLYSYGQAPMITATVGLSSLQGETTEGNLMPDEIGLNYSVKYLLPFKDERLMFYGEANHTHIKLFREFKNSRSFSKFFYNNFSQSYLGAGFRFYFNKSINKLNPYAGQFLPYVAVSVGALSTNRDVMVQDATPQVLFKNPPSDPMEHYSVTEGQSFEFNGQAEAGFVLVLDERFSFEAFGAARPGFTDDWDGLEGTSKRRDWLLTGGMGLQYRLP